MLLELQSLPAVDVMSKDYHLLKENDTISKAEDVILRNYKKEIFVIDDNGKIQGIVTMGDICKLLRYNDLREEACLKDIMKKDVISVTVATPLQECRDIMIENHIGRLPVLREKNIVGVIRIEHIIDFFRSKIKETLEIFDYILDNIHEAVCVIDSTGRVIVWNDNAEKLYNISKEVILGRKLDEFFSDSIDMQVLKTKQILKNVYHTPKEDCNVIISASPILSDDELIGVVSTDKDVEEMRKISQELKKTEERLSFLEGQLEKLSRKKFGFVIGKSKTIQEKIEIGRLAAKSNVPILITGESGTGKEVFARAIHNYSKVKGKFVPVNCSAIPKELFESEFFGYEPGAFTGASRKGKAGYFELANNGTLFLDEIADLPLSMQAKLLRVLQDYKVKRLGAENFIEVNVRIISATNQNLEEQVKKKKFREDLYYRLNVIKITLPPLRETRGYSFVY